MSKELTKLEREAEAFVKAEWEAARARARKWYTTLVLRLHAPGDIHRGYFACNAARKASAAMRAHWDPYDNRGPDGDGCFYFVNSQWGYSSSYNPQYPSPRHERAHIRFVRGESRLYCGVHSWYCLRYWWRWQALRYMRRGQVPRIHMSILNVPDEWVFEGRTQCVYNHTRARLNRTLDPLTRQRVS